MKQIAPFENTEGWTLRHKLWATMVLEVDHSVATLVEEIKRLGIEKNTLFIFAADNGYSMWGYFGPRPRYADDPIFQNKGPWKNGKFINTNGGLIVPFIAWWPKRVPAGSTPRRAIDFSDFMATAAELAGANLPGPTDGVSYVALLEGREKDQPLRHTIFWPASVCNFTSGIRDEWAAPATARKKPEIPDAMLLDER